MTASGSGPAPAVLRQADVDLMRSADELATAILADAGRRRGRRERAQAARMSHIMADAGAREAILALTDEVLRVRSPKRAAIIFGEIAERAYLNSAFGPFDRVALMGGARLASTVPDAVVPLVRARVRSEMSGVVLPAGRMRLTRHAEQRARQGIGLNINVLGEAVLGEAEAARRMDQVIETLTDPVVDYVSVKISSVCAQLDVLAFSDEVDRIADRLRRLYDVAMRFDPPKFVNLDMEEYRDLELTVAVFERVLDEPAYATLGAGIVLQAYLPDSLEAMRELCDWARRRHENSGGWIKVRIVKGANLAMETVDAEIHGWQPAPFATKDETDASYKRMLEVALEPAHHPAIRVGVATHNLFELSWAAVVAADLGSLDRVEFEMLEGMSPAVAEAVADRLGGLRLYAPIVDVSEIEAAIAYLVRRLDENSGPDNFITHQFAMTPGSPDWERERLRFHQAVQDRRRDVDSTRRTQDRGREERRGSPSAAGDATAPFRNEPDTDFTVAANRDWARGHLAATGEGRSEEYRPLIGGRPFPGGEAQDGVDPSQPHLSPYRWYSASDEAVEAALSLAREGAEEWGQASVEKRVRVLESAAGALARARGRLLAVMARDTGKTLREGDPEVSEAIDFARFYARTIPDPATGFRPLGTVVVASPWNFPLSIPAGGVLAALAAGNSVILKPAPEAVAVAGELARCLLAAGVPASAFQYVPCVDSDISRRLITDPRVDAVVLTGAWATAQEFLRWRPDLRLHAETSGKNAVIITATADPDQAIADLVHSAFGHAGQKCSAASLAIVESAIHDDGRFLRRLADAVSSSRVGSAASALTTMGPLIRPPEGPLLRALTRLDPGEKWLVEPQKLDHDGYLWSPGVKEGVAPKSWFHLTECFGPVLGIMRAEDLEQALAWQNTPDYGLTAGLQALDPAEVEHWRDHVDAGNLYVNKGITGAVVRRQPFGGWKRSVVGPGAKAGGPNYVASLGTWADSGRRPDASALRAAWRDMQVPTDPTGLRSESNAFRYRPLRRVALWVQPGTPPDDVTAARAAAGAVGVQVVEVDRPEGITTGDKVRILGTCDEAALRRAAESGLWVDRTSVGDDPTRELQRWTREQAVSESRHRHGNITRRRPGLVPLVDG